MNRSSRRLMLIAMGVCSALLLGFALKIFLMLGFDAAGRGAGEQGDHARAAEAYSSNLTLNIVEPWVAHANRGAALYHAEDFEGAEKEFRKAVKSVSKKYSCMVTLDLAWSIEAQGDKFDGEGNAEEAKKRWEAAAKVLEGKGCGSLDKHQSESPTPTPTPSESSSTPTPGSSSSSSKGEKSQEPSADEQKEQRNKTKDRLQKKVEQAGQSSASAEPSQSSAQPTQQSSADPNKNKTKQKQLQQKMEKAERERRQYEPYERNKKVDGKNW